MILRYSKKFENLFINVIKFKKYIRLLLFYQFYSQAVYNYLFFNYP